MVSTRALVLAGLVMLAAALLITDPLAAQEAGALARQNLRPYQYLFAAYAIAWALVFGWIVAVARRLSRLDRRLRD